MLSTKRSTSWFFSSRKYSAIASAGERDAETGTRRLVHLAVDQTDLGAFLEEDEVAVGILDRMALLVLLHGDDAGLDHFAVEIVALAGTLADTREDASSRRGPWRCC